MNKPGVTQAQLQRAVSAFEAMGKTVTGCIIRPDGSWEVLLGGDTDAALEASKARGKSAWDKRLGL